MGCILDPTTTTTVNHELSASESTVFVEANTKVQGESVVDSVFIVPDLLCHVFRFLDWSTVLHNCAIICLQWNNTVSNPGTFQHLQFHKCFHPRKYYIFKQTITRFQNVQILDINLPQIIATNSSIDLARNDDFIKLCKHFTSFTKIHSLTIKFPQFTNDRKEFASILSPLLKSVYKNGYKLKNLHLSHFDVISMMMHMVNEMADCNYNYNTKAMDIDFDVGRFGGFINLTELYLDGCFIDPFSCDIIFSSEKKLELLSLTHMVLPLWFWITMKDLKSEIESTLKNLKTLTIKQINFDFNQRYCKQQRRKMRLKNYHCTCTSKLPLCDDNLSGRDIFNILSNDIMPQIGYKLINLECLDISLNSILYILAKAVSFGQYDYKHNQRGSNLRCVNVRLNRLRITDDMFAVAYGYGIHKHQKTIPALMRINEIEDDIFVFDNLSNIIFDKITVGLWNGDTRWIKMCKMIAVPYTYVSKSTNLPLGLISNSCDNDDDDDEKTSSLVNPVKQSLSKAIYFISNVETITFLNCSLPKTIEILETLSGDYLNSNGYDSNGDFNSNYKYNYHNNHINFELARLRCISIDNDQSKSANSCWFSRVITACELIDKLIGKSNNEMIEIQLKMKIDCGRYDIQRLHEFLEFIRGWYYNQQRLIDIQVKFTGTAIQWANIGALMQTFCNKFKTIDHDVMSLDPQKSLRKGSVKYQLVDKYEIFLSGLKT